MTAMLRVRGGGAAALALAVVLLALTGHAARAEGGLTGFLGYKGCTLGPQERSDAIAAGFSAEQIDAEVDAALADGRATQQGRFVVFGVGACAIKLPRITTETALDAPEIKVRTSAFDQFAADGNAGCFLLDASVYFKERDPTPAGNDSYLQFYAAHIMSGDLRFHGPDPLRTPPGLQVLSGDCGKVANAEDIARSQRYISDAHFAKYIRWQMAQTECSGNSNSPMGMQFTAEMQGMAVDGSGDATPPINAWLYFEYDLIAMAAGWREGMSWTSKGNLRPPLCHYGAG